MQTNTNKGDGELTCFFSATRCVIPPLLTGKGRQVKCKWQSCFFLSLLKIPSKRRLAKEPFRAEIQAPPNMRKVVPAYGSLILMTRMMVLGRGGGYPACPFLKTKVSSA